MVFPAMFTVGMAIADAADKRAAPGIAYRQSA